MTESRSPFVCAACGDFTAELHCELRSCDWLVCSVCELVINDEHKTMYTRERFLRDLYGQHPSTGA